MCWVYNTFCVKDFFRVLHWIIGDTYQNERHHMISLCSNINTVLIKLSIFKVHLFIRIFQSWFTIQHSTLPNMANVGKKKWLPSYGVVARIIAKNRPLCIWWKSLAKGICNAWGSNDEFPPNASNNIINKHSFQLARPCRLFRRCYSDTTTSWVYCN